MPDYARAAERYAATVGPMLSGIGLEVDDAPRPEPIEPPPDSSTARPRPTSTPRGKAAKQLTARNLADNLLSVGGMLAVGVTGSPDANPSPIEAEMIAVPLAEILADSNALAKAAKVANPAMLCFGLTMWGARVYTLYRARHPKRPRPVEQPTARPSWGGIIRGRKAPGPEPATVAPGYVEPAPEYVEHVDPVVTPGGPLPANIRDLMGLHLE
jgi:hypothetical protein